jgi:hypothetical protein
MSVGTRRQNIIILFLEITVLFLGLHKWDPDIYIGILTGPSFAVFIKQQQKKNYRVMNSA